MLASFSGIVMEWTVRCPMEWRDCVEFNARIGRRPQRRVFGRLSVLKFKRQSLDTAIAPTARDKGD